MLLQMIYRTSITKTVSPQERHNSEFQWGFLQDQRLPMHLVMR